MDEKAKQKTAIIVGAGVGGVATAARLAKAGFQVTVVEKNDFSGGRCSLIHHDGFRFDQGPSLLLLPNLFREAFEDLGTTLEAEGVNILKCEPNYSIWFGDGEHFELSTDVSRMKTEIEKWEGKDGFERYLGFLQESHRHYEISVREVLHKNFTSIFNMLRLTFLPHLLALHPFESIYSRASRYFWTERLRRVFTFGSMYMGMSPFDAPGTYSLLQYTELAEGIWYPEGGFHKVVEALVNIGERTGVTYRFSTPIRNIATSRTDSSLATGVVLANGEQLNADVVICNADLVYAYNNLLPPSSHAKSLTHRKASCSSLSFYWTLSTQIPQLKAHNIFLADEYRESFDSIFKQQSLPSEPSFYVNVPSRIDPSAAPAGKDAIVVLCPIGHLLPAAPGTSEKGLNPQSDAEWAALISKARTAILQSISSRIGVDISLYITHEILNTPITWRDTFNLDKGAILGLSHSFFNVLAFRPSTKHASIKNLYFVGASTHPGTGVPIVLAGSKITSEQLLEDFGMEVPWGPGVSLDERGVAKRKAGGRGIGRGMGIDTVHTWSPLLSWFHIVLTILVALMGLVMAGYLGVR